MLADRLGEAGDLVRRLALEAQRDEEAADLGGSRLAAHDRAHGRACLRAAQIPAVQQVRENLLHHRRSSRKLRTRSGPVGVSTDSGWNWTPSTGSSRCRTAITSPSTAVAEISSTAGMPVAASE